MKQFYISNMNDLNDYEKEHNRISYARLCDRAFSSMILCNEIEKVDPSIFDNAVVGCLWDEENDVPVNIYQYYLVSLNLDIEDIKEKWGDNLIIAYCELLDLYVLCVDHYGTSWDYVLTDIEPATEL